MRFESFREVHNAYRVGLIEPEDEILEDGTEKWRQAQTYPMLRDLPRSKKRTLPGPQILAALGSGIAALIALFTGRWLAGLALGCIAAVSATLGANRAARPPRR